MIQEALVTMIVAHQAVLKDDLNEDQPSWEAAIPGISFGTLESVLSTSLVGEWFTSIELGALLQPIVKTGLPLTQNYEKAPSETAVEISFPIYGKKQPMILIDDYLEDQLLAVVQSVISFTSEWAAGLREETLWLRFS